VRNLPAGTVTLLFTDIEGSTRLLHELGEERYAAELAQHRRALREAFDRHGGVEVDTQGDAFFVAFAEARDAVEAAREAQASLSVPVRMGLHTGTPLLTDEGYVGTDVHRAARIAAAGHGGQVLVSSSTAELIGPSNTVLQDLGEHRLKDLSAPERIWQLGEAEFPRLKTLYQTNLPVPATPFLGREQDLAEVAELLAEPGTRLVTLTGPGGTGKTRLALQAVADSAERFPDGITWVPLASLRDASLVLPTIAEALGVADDELPEVLGGRKRLLLLDNAEHLLPELADQLSTIRAIEGPLLLVTSRERLQLQGEHVYAVAPLGDDDAVQLFLERSAALGVELERSPAVIELCRRLDDLPLALELAAARTPLFSPEQLVERLSGRLDLLKGGRDADPRQQTLRSTIEWSYDLLDEEERRLFRRLSVFVAGCSLEWAEEICGADPDTLQSLLDKSLVRRLETGDAPRFWMLETLREYAGELLERSEERPQIEDGLIDAACNFAVAAEPAWRVGNQAEWLPRFDFERDNLRRAIRAALERGDAERSLTISVNLGWLWQIRGLTREFNDWVERGLAAGSELDPVLEGYALFALGIGYVEIGERERGQELLERSLPALETGGMGHHHAFALYYLGGLLIAAGRVDEGEDVLRRSEQEALELDDPTLVSTAREGLAEVYAARGDLARARDLLVAITAVAPSPAHRALHAANLAEVVAAEGEIEQARSILAESRTICEEGGYGRELAWVLQIEAYLDLEAGRRDEATALLEEVRAMAEDSGARDVVGRALLGLAVVEARWGSRDEALELWNRARELGGTEPETSWRLGRKLEREFLEPLRGA